MVGKICTCNQPDFYKRWRNSNYRVASFFSHPIVDMIVDNSLLKKVGEMLRQNVININGVS